MPGGLTVALISGPSHHHLGPLGTYVNSYTQINLLNGQYKYRYNNLFN